MFLHYERGELRGIRTNPTERFVIDVASAARYYAGGMKGVASVKVESAVEEHLRTLSPHPNKKAVEEYAGKHYEALRREVELGVSDPWGVAERVFSSLEEYRFARLARMLGGVEEEHNISLADYLKAQKAAQKYPCRD